MKSTLSRRGLFGCTLAAAGLSVTRAFGMSRGDKALVGIYLFGGNDSNNMIVPLESYDVYALARGPLAQPKADLLPVRSRLDGTDYGFHGAMPEVRDLFNAGVLGVVSNIGLTPRGADPVALNRSLFELPGPLDPNLAYFPPGYSVPQWAARLASVTPGSRSKLWVEFPELRPGGNTCDSVALITPDMNATSSTRDALKEAAKTAETGTPIEFPDTGLGQQLRQIASMIRRSWDLRLGSQIYHCALGGFGLADYHPSIHAALLGELSSALGAFHAAMDDLGLSDSVTVYTDTERSRTLVPNSSGRTDPGWGGHQLILGGGVLGGTVHGTFPNLAPGGPSDSGNRGIWLPTSSKDQYAATLANWFGLSHSDLDDHVLGTSSISRRTLGFMVTG